MANSELPINASSGQVTSEHWLGRHRREIETERATYRRRELAWSWARLLVFVAIIVGWVLSGDNWWIAGGVTLVGFIAFGWAVRRHREASRLRAAAEARLLVADESLRRCGGHVLLIRSWARPADPRDPDSLLDPVLDTGPTWALTDQERDDLDLFVAPVGLFGLLNRTSTSLGSRRLRDGIEHSPLAPQRIETRQHAVRWLDENSEARLRMMGALAGLRGRDADLDRLVAAIRRTAPVHSRVPIHVMRWWGVPSLLFTFVALGQAMSGGYAWLLSLLVLLSVNALALRRARSSVNALLGAWRTLALATEGYLAVAQQGIADLPRDGELGKLNASFASVVRRDVLPGLCRCLPWTETGGVMHAVSNLVFFYDLHVADGILRRVLPQREALLAGLSALAELEALASLGCFAWEQPVRCYPTPTTEPGLHIADGRHPLIEPRQGVPNDVELSDSLRMWIVTGSNMAGKSTFLRMTGVNVLLAQLGTVAVAREMRWTPARIMTDLRARDSLSKDESYFLAEVRQLRRMLTSPTEDAPILGLIDEPLRGTNSQERAAASVAVIQHLQRSRDLFLVATHEALLTSLAGDGSAAANMHFQEALEADGLVFDYRLRSGPAHSRNALLVMEREGYPPLLMAAARKWLAGNGDAPTTDASCRVS